MPVSSPQKDRIVGRYFVQIPTGGKHWRLPESFNPSATGNPFAGLCLIDARFYFGQKVLEVGDAFEIQIPLALPHADEVIMRVRQAGQNRGATKIDHARFRSPVSPRLRV